MEYKGKVMRCKKLEDWLGGVSLGEKIKTLEKGKRLTCSKCGFSIFDKEEPENRIRRGCVSFGQEHSFVESDSYLILRRGFIGIIDALIYHFGTPEEAVIRHFQRRR